MENDCREWEQRTLIRELIQGMEMTKQLKEELTSTSPDEISRELLVEGILSSYENALLILQWSGGGGSTAPPPFNGSPPAEELGRGVEDDSQETEKRSKKRKLTPKWTEQVRVNPENGFEGQHEDSHSWRKYGQKDILGSRFPRSYYRCSYRHTQKCWATKQVQRSDNNNGVFEITYRGKHTCSNGGGQPRPPLSLQEQQPNKNQTLHRQQNHEESGPGFCFPSSSFGRGLGFAVVDDDSSLFNTSSPPIVFPNALESSSGGFLGEIFANLGGRKAQRSESDLTEIFSATTSSTDSPVVELDFALDSVQIESNFLFGSGHGFYP